MYQKYIGQFKKPGIGMLMVIKDLICKNMDLQIKDTDIIFIGDTWHDKEAAQKVGFGFVHADDLHRIKG